MIPDRSNWHQYAPGIFSDDQNQLHVYPAEILAHLGLPDTRENHAQIEREMEEVLKKLKLSIPIKRVEDHE